MLMMQESSYVNSMQSYHVPHKECFRKTMLHQEIVFRNQVQELHRLYGMQKILMGDIGLKQLDSCTGSPWSIYSHNSVRCESSASLIEDAKLPSTAMLVSTLAKSEVLPSRHNSVYNSIHLEPLGLQFCSDQCTSHVDQQELNLSLSITQDRGIKATFSNCFDQKINSSTQNVIDFELSTEGISNEEGNCAPCATTFATKTRCESQVPFLSGMMENTSCPFGNGEYSQGFEGCHKVLMVNKSSLKDCISHEARKLDLNQVQLDGSSGHSSDNLVNCHSTASSLHIFGISFDRTSDTTLSTHPSATWRKENSKSECDASFVKNSNNINEISDPKYKTIKSSDAGLMGNHSVAKTWVAPCTDLSSCMRYPGSQFTDPDGTYMVTKVVKCDNTKEDEISCACQSPTEEKYEDGNILPALCESSCVIDNSGIIKTKKPQISLADTILITPDQSLGAGNGNDLGHDCPKKVELPEVSMCIQNAARLLLNFSLGSSSSYQDCASKVESIKVDKENEKLECSDSFEQIALELEECNVDDNSVSSKPYEIDSTEKKGFGYRLKRGRRFKDFQKEILPGMASLSRHEIQEDINILEAVLRSREYQKIRARMDDQSSWCAPMRSRRSKRNNVRRKIF